MTFDEIQSLAAYFEGAAEGAQGEADVLQQKSAAFYGRAQQLEAAARRLREMAQEVKEARDAVDYLVRNMEENPRFDISRQRYLLREWGYKA